MKGGDGVKREQEHFPDRGTDTDEALQTTPLQAL